MIPLHFCPCEEGSNSSAQLQAGGLEGANIRKPLLVSHTPPRLGNLSCQLSIALFSYKYKEKTYMRDIYGKGTHTKECIHTMRGHIQRGDIYKREHARKGDINGEGRGNQL